MKHHSLLLLIAATLALPGLSAHAAMPSLKAQASAESSSPKKPKKVKKAKANKGANAVFYDGSGETANQRERRLLRECRGRPNAGVCEGYTRP